MIGIGVYAFGISYFELHHWLNKDTIELTKNISVIYSILGFTLSLLLVFRTNSAYDRWWEGRKHWGTLMNSSRSLASHFGALVKNEERGIIAQYLSVFAYVLQAHLRGQKVSYEDITKKFNPEITGSDNIKKIAGSAHQPLETYRQLVDYIHTKKDENKFTVQDIYLVRPELNSLIDVCGACERIKNTPIPFSYSVFLKKFIFFYVMLFPMVYGLNMSYFIIPVTIFILYVLASIELIAEEIEDPFNGEANDLPTAEIAENIRKSVDAVLLR